jgi:hypothetical protein
MGAVVVDTVTGMSRMFGGAVPPELVADWRSDGRIQTIGQAELLPVLMCRLTFSELLRHRRVFYYIDNDSARMALIKGHSPSVSSYRIISAIAKLEVESQSWSWYSRIPSHSNPSDGPSRSRLVAAAENLFSTPVPMLEIPRSVYSS